MKSILFLFVTLLSFSALADEAQPGQFWCDHRFKDQIVEINEKSSVDGCVADLIWGFDNVCFTGEASDLVDDINNDKYKWTSSGLILADASYDSEKDLLLYTGVDQQSFFSSERDLARCTEEFFKTSED
ncbi:MAG: hypothetical protein HRT44_04875 [Bdellovibrionales bacterium]|nr:hypothetical protein [Bdellovibrionales bacterium]